MKTLFEKYPQISPDEPMMATDFYKWLEQNEFEYWVLAFRSYIAEHGFNRDKNIVDGTQLDAHKSVFSYFWDNKLNNRI